MATIVIKDKNLVPQNIKKGVTILKVTGTLEGGGGVNNQDKTVSSSTSNQTVTYDSGYTGLGTVTVNKYTLDSKTVEPSTSQQTVNSSADGLSSVTVNAVTSSIDGNIQAGNIKKDVTILGVIGTYESTPVQPVLQDVSVSYSQNGSYTLEASSGYDGLGTVDIDVSVASQGGSDWVMEAKAGRLTDLSPYHVGYDVLSKDYGMSYMFRYCSTITKAPVIDSSYIAANGLSSAFQSCSLLTDASFPNLASVSGSYGMSNTFQNTSLTSVSFPALTTVSGENGMYEIFKSCSSLTSVSFPALTTVSGTTGMGYVFVDCSSLTDASFPALTTVSGSYGMTYAFIRCTSLTSVSFPALTTLGSSGMRRIFQDCTSLTSASFPLLTNLGSSAVDYMFTGCSNLTNLLITPKAFTKSGESNPVNNISALTNIQCVGNTNENVYLTWQPNLTAESVYNILTALDSQTSGKTVQFYWGGLNVTDYSDGRIQTAYNAATTAGWTISNLTIVQPEPEPEPEPESEPCPACSGTGIDPETGETCSTCDGSGVIS